MKTMRMSGTLVGETELNPGKFVHLLEDHLVDEYGYSWKAALCGAKPGRASSVGYRLVEDEVTCRRCIHIARNRGEKK